MFEHNLKPLRVMQDLEMQQYWENTLEITSIPFVVDLALFSPVIRHF